MAGYYWGDDWQRELEQRRLDADQAEARARIAAKAKDPNASPEERARAARSLELWDR
jgi:hypothetical protein